VIHTTEGSYASAIRGFAHAGANASADYVVRSSDGAITQMVPEADIAWHSGNRQYNATSIGIEHEAFVHNCSWYTSAMYRSSARLVAYLTRKYGIPVDRTHIIGHYQVPDPYHPDEFGGFAHHTDPGPCWDWRKYMRLVRIDAGQIPAQKTADQVVSDETRADFRAPGWRRKVGADAEQQFGSSYAVARPNRSAAPASFRLTVPAAGDYAVYAWWPANRTRNPAVPVGISTVTGWHWLKVNERHDGGRWRYLGTFPLAAGKGWDVRVSRDSAVRGSIAANAVTAEPVQHLLQSHLFEGGSGYALTGSALLLTSDAGSTWRAATPPGLVAADIRAVDFIDPENGFVVAAAGTEGQGFALWRTNDSGVTWTSSPLAMPTSVDVAAPISITAPDTSHVSLSLSIQQGLPLRGPGVILESSDGGQTWSHAVLPADGSIEFTTPAEGWLAADDGGVYRTRDGGGTWRRVAFPAPTEFHSTLPSAEPPTFSDPTQAVLPVTFRRGSRAAVSFLASHDGGSTWQSAATITGHRVFAPTDTVPVAIVDATHWMAFPHGGRRAVSLTNGKVAQTVATTGLPFSAPGFELKDVSFASASTGWATVSTCEKPAGSRCPRSEALYRTVDAGATWNPLNVPSVDAETADTLDVTGGRSKEG
jgi:hypothetical protein